MAGDSGREAENKVAEAPKSVTLQEKLANAGTNPRVLEALRNYGSGKTSLKDALGSVSGGYKGPAPKKFVQEEFLNDLEKNDPRYAELNAGMEKFGASRWDPKSKAGLAQAAAMGIPDAVNLVNLENSLNKDREDKLNAARAQSEADQKAYDQNVENAQVEERALKDEMVLDPTTGTLMARDQVTSDPTLGKLFGEGGLMSRADKEEQDLASRGYSLQPEDYEAYGQTSGNLARLFGQQEQDVAASLASRGLAAAPSGAAGVAYSGLAGNKMEQLARAQTDVAQKRMQTNMQRLQQTRSLMQGLGSDYGTQLSNQYNRNLAGVQTSRGNLNAAGNQMQNQQQMQQGQANQAFEQREATRTPSLGEVMANAGTSALGQAVGGLGKGLTTGLGYAIGGPAGGAAMSGKLGG